MTMPLLLLLKQILSLTATLFFLWAVTLIGIYLLLPVLPLAYFSPPLFRKWTDHLMASAITLTLTTYQWIFGVEVVVSGDAIDHTKPALIIMNHRTRLDWLHFWQAMLLIDHRLIRTQKVALKAPLRHFPGVGWCMALYGFLFLRRNMEGDSKLLHQTIKYFKKSGGVYQLLWFPEGTDLTPNTLSISHSFALANNLPPLHNVLQPRTNGFSHLTELMHSLNYLDCIYDVTVGYSHSIVQRELEFLVGGRAPERVHFHIQKVEVEGKSDDWLMKRWQEKEHLLEHFYSIADPDERTLGEERWTTGRTPASTKAYQRRVFTFWAGVTIFLLPFLPFHIPYPLTFFITAILFFVVATARGDGLSSIMHHLCEKRG